MVKTCGIVLAGGKSSRMGKEKALLLVNGKTLIERILNQLKEVPLDEIIVVGDSKLFSISIDVRFVPDEKKGYGPLMGIISGLRASHCDQNLVVACDIPILDKTFLLNLIAGSRPFDIYVPRHKNGQYEPLLAIYKKSILPLAENLINCGKRKVDILFSLCHCGFMDIDELSWLININTPQEYNNFLRKLQTKKI